MQIIGLNGFKRSGKNTSAGLIQDHHEGVVYQIGFADKVKIAGARTLGFLDLSPRECIALMDKAKERWVFEISAVVGKANTDEPVIDLSFHTLTGREYLQNIGTEMRKLFGKDFWVDQVLPRPMVAYTMTAEMLAEADQIRLAQRFPEVDCVTITDLRFENEAERVLALGGEVWRINRPGTESDGHDSEQVLPDHLVSREIHNTSDLEGLSSQIYAALSDLR